MSRVGAALMAVATRVLAVCPRLATLTAEVGPYLLRGRSRAQARAVRGALWLALRQPRRASRSYEAAVEEAATSNDPSVVASRHRWEFMAERILARAGRPRVRDPLVGASVERVVLRGAAQHAGVFAVHVGYGGLWVRGFLLRRSPTAAVTVTVDGVEIRRTATGSGPLPVFSVVVRRDALETFPSASSLVVDTDDGGELRPGLRRRRVRLRLPEGRGTLHTHLTHGRQVDKKGSLTPSPGELRERQAAYLELYAAVRDALREESGKDLFVLYGTLLGAVREGDFIPGDDDFDVGYVSDHADPREVRRESLRIMHALAHRGFDLSVNRAGRPFRVHPPAGGGGDLHLDARPVWFRDGRVWAHKRYVGGLGVVDFLPVRTHDLRGVEVLVPRNPEGFLASYYGEGWRVPDPSFTNQQADLPPAHRRQLAAAQLSVAEMRHLQGLLDDERGEGTGRFLPVALRPLYPLTRAVE